VGENGGMPPPDLDQRMRLVRESTARLLLDLDGLSEVDVRGDSLLPGWTVGHVLTHLARNADAFAGLLAAAQRREQPLMYPSTQARADDIEAGSGRPADALTEDVRDSAQRLDELWLAMRADDWDAPTKYNGLAPAADTISGRWREVEIHHVDLDLGYGPQEWPAEFCQDVLDGQSGAALARRLPVGTSLVLHATDAAGQWVAGERDAREVAVHGPAWALASWLVGRPQPALGALKTDGGELPELGFWR
jgi:maleylpyruvate isomerase